jgi:putative peptidoglycan lipid II flippase
MASRILGLAREQVMAYLFGAGNAVDAFNVAFRIPNLVRDLFAEGVMSAALVPTFTRSLTRDGRAAAWRLGNHVVNGLLVATIVIVVAGLVFAHPFVMLLAGDFAAVPGKIELTVVLTRVMMPFLILVALAAAAMGMLNSLDRYFVPALAPAVFNVLSILTTIALVPVLTSIGLPIILSVAFGVLVGGFGQFAVQVPSLYREGFRYEPRLDPSEPRLREVLLLMGPGTLGLAATQINMFVNTWLATGQGTGAVSWLAYAYRLMYLPLGIFGASIATASIPAIARRAAEGDLAGLRKTLSSGIAMMLTLNVPATLGLIVLSHPIVALLFERGRFTAADTTATANAVICYAVGLTGYSIVKVATPTFYALGDSRTPVVLSVMTVLANAALNLAFVHSLGYRGLALGTSLAALFNAGALLLILRTRLGGIDGGRLGSVLARQGAASVVMAAAAWIVEWRLSAALPAHDLLSQLVHVGVAIVVALVVLVAASRLLGVSELNEVVDGLIRRLRRPGRSAPPQA